MMKAFALCLTAAAILCCVSPRSTLAGEARTHDGFFLRLSAGGGTAGSEITALNSISVDLSGIAYDLDIAIGGMVKPNLAIHGTIFGWSVSDPDADVIITGFGSGSGTLPGTATMSAFGPGVTYYFMPVNIYVSGSVGFGRFKLDGNDLEMETKQGLALDFALGKEWWVGNSWGLGLAGGVTYHSLEDKEVNNENWSGTSVALRFTATHN